MSLKTKVLLIEDNAGDVRLVREMLAEAGGERFDLTSCDRLSAGLEHLAKSKFDLVLLDLGLPDSQGLDTLERIRTEAPDVPIIVMTGLEDEAVALKAMEFGAQDYLVKWHVESTPLARAMLYAVERFHAHKALEDYAEQLLRAAQEWRTTFDSITDLVSVHDKNCRIVRVNRAFARTFGLEPKELIGKTCWEVLHGQSEPIESCPHLRTMATGLPSALEIFEPRLGAYLSVSAAPIFDDKGQPVGAVHIIKDITQQKRAEAQLRESERKYATLVEQGDDGIAIGQDGLLAFANAKVAEMTGFSLAELLGKPFIDFVAPEHREPVVESYRKVMAGEEASSRLEIELLTRAAKRIPVEVNATRIDYQGRPAALAFIRDITKRREAQAELRLRAHLLDTANDAITIRDREGNFIYLNERAERLFGYSKDEMMKLNLRDLLPPEKAGLFEATTQLIEEKGEATVESVRVRKDRSLIPVEIHARTIEIGGRKLFYSVVRDITERKQAQEALRRAHEFQETVLNSTNDAVCLIDVYDYRILGVNQAFLKQYGVKEAEVIGRTCYEVTHHCAKPCDQIGEVCPLLDTVSTCQPATAEHVHYNSNGEAMYLEVVTFPVRDAEGRVIQAVHVARDVTERHKAEEIFRTVADNSPIGISIIQKGILRYVNPHALRGLGYMEPELVGTEAARLVHPEDREMERRNAIRMLKEEAVPPYEFRIITKTGEVKWVVEKVASIRHEGQRATLASFMDITELKLADKALHDSEEKLRLMFDCVTDGIVVTDLEMRMVQVNDAVLRQFGNNDKAELMGRKLLELVAEKERPALAENIKNTREKGYGGRVALTAQRKDGSQFPVEFSINVLRDAYFKLIGFVSVIEDISAQKRIEEQLMLADRLASIGELASGIAHELNNPLTSVIGFSQLLLEKDIPDKVREDVKIVASEAQRAAQVVRNLLTFARKHAPTKQPANISTIIEKVLELRAYEQRVSNITVLTRFAPDLPAIMIDDFQMQQVFFNIIINAEYFMLEAHGRGTLTITTERVGGIVRVSFADNGPGIPKGNLEHVFDPFFTTKDVGKGTGLGLSICHGIVTSHGGRIYVESELGEGATFIVELPVGS